MTRAVTLLLTLFLAASRGASAQTETANIKGEEQSIAQTSNKLDGALSGTDSNDSSDPAIVDASSASPVFAELLSCRKDLDQEERKQLELQSEAETCQTQLDRVQARIDTAVQAVTRRDSLRTEAAGESQRAVEAEKNALELMEKEKDSKVNAAQGCDEQIQSLNTANAAAIAEAKKNMEEKMQKIRDAEAQMEVKIQVDEANAISDAQHQADANIATSLHHANSAVSEAQSKEADAIHDAEAEAKREEIRVKAQLLEEFEQKKKELEAKLTSTQQERDDAVKQLTDEKDALNADVQTLQSQVNQAEKAEYEAATGRHIAETSLQKFKQFASGMISSTQSAVSSAESVASAGVASTKTALGPSLDAEIEAAHAAAEAAKQATKAAQHVATLKVR